MAACCKAVTEDIPYQLILNCDAVQFTVGNTTEDKIEIYYVEDNGRPNLKATPPKETSGITAYFVKYCAVICAGGKAAHHVFILK